jgi:hypothetical protein
VTWHGSNGKKPPHAVVRAAERYGIALTLADLDAIMLSITGAKLGLPSTALLQRIEKTGEYWFVDVAGARVRVVYRAETACVVTVLPMRDETNKLNRPTRGAQRDHMPRRRERPVVEEWA